MRKFHLANNEKSYTLENSDDLLVVRTNDGLAVKELDLGEYNFLKSYVVKEGEFPESNVIVYRVKTNGKYKLKELRDLLKAQLRNHRSIKFAGRGLQYGGSKLFNVYTENLFIKFKKEISETRCLELIKEFELEKKLKLGFASNAFFVQAKDGIGQDVFVLAEKILALSEVESCHPELVTNRKKLDKNFKEFYTDKGIATDWAHNQIKLNEAWEYTKGEGIKICIIDDGIELSHQAFKDKIHESIDMLERYGISDASHKFPTERHGTACASVACANDENLKGVAPESKLIPIRSKGLGSVLEAQAFYEAVKSGADIISCSWGPPDGSIDTEADNEIDFPIPDHTHLAIEYAATKGRGGKGCLIFFAAGNGKEPIVHDGYASHEYVMAVGATNLQKKLSYYSDYGAPIFCVFPGGEVITPDSKTGISVADRKGLEGFSPTDYYNLFQGTSASSPGMAGVAALMLSLNPNLTRLQAKNLLASACINQLTDNSRYDEKLYGNGLIDANLLMELTIESKKLKRMNNYKKTYALHIGVDLTNPSIYGTQFPSLNGCVADATLFGNLTGGFSERQRLYNDQATREAVLLNLKQMTEKASSGDLVFISYSGHGSFVDDLDGDELDRKDETLVLFDGLLIDDEIRNTFYKFKEGVDVIWISDSCHSGTNSRGAEMSTSIPRLANANTKYRQLSGGIAQAVFNKTRSNYLARLSDLDIYGVEEDDINYKANIITMAACLDDQYAMEVSGNGLFTSAFMKVLGQGTNVTLEELFKGIKQELRNATQEPKLEKLGPKAQELFSKPFLGDGNNSADTKLSFGSNICETCNKQEITDDRFFTGKLIVASDKPLSFDRESNRKLKVAGEGMLRSNPFEGNNEWDKAYDAFLSSDGAVDYIEPDVISTINREVSVQRGDDDKFLYTYPNPDESEEEKSFVWHLNDKHSQLYTAARNACPELINPLLKRKDNYPRIAIIDTGILPGNPTMPENYNRVASRNFSQPEDIDYTFKVIEQQGHGQATMAILAGPKISAEDTNGEYAGYFGAFPLAEVVSLRISDKVAILSGRKFAEAVEYAVNILQCDVITMSMAGMPTKKMQDAINLAYEAGVVLVSAGGNSWSRGAQQGLPDSLMYPARFDRVIAVTGSTVTGTPYRNDENEERLRNKGSLHMGTCFGPEEAMSTVIAAYTPNISWVNSDYDPSQETHPERNPLFIRKGGGTSSATPQVSAAAAIYLHKYRSWFDKNLPKTDKGNCWKRAEIIRQALFRSAEKNIEAEFKKYYGQGLLKAENALKAEFHPKEILENLMENEKAAEANIGFTGVDEIVKMWLQGRRGANNYSNGLASMLSIELEQLIMTSPDLARFSGYKKLSQKLIKKVIENDDASDLLKSMLSTKLKNKKKRRLRTNEMIFASIVDMLDEGADHGVKIVSSGNYEKTQVELTPEEKDAGCLGSYEFSEMNIGTRSKNIDLQLMVPDSDEVICLVTQIDEDGKESVQWLIPQELDGQFKSKSEHIIGGRYSKGTYVYDLNQKMRSKGPFSKIKKVFVQLYKTAVDLSVADIDGMIKVYFEKSDEDPKGGLEESENVFIRSLQKNEIKKLPNKRYPPILLLLHGTFSSVISSFDDLLEDKDFQDFVKEKYGENIIGFNMSTIKSGVKENATELLKHLRNKGISDFSSIDVMATSRGCLVARLAFSAEDLKMVLSAGTHLGTPIAKMDRIRNFIDRVTQLSILKYGSVGPVVPRVLKAINWLIMTVTNSPGIADQAEDSDLVKELQEDYPMDANHLLFGNNFNPDNLGKYLDMVPDYAIFNNVENDGVTTLLSALAMKTKDDVVAHKTHFVGDATKGHFSYYQDKDTVMKAIGHLS